jgi:hypothetical protein
MRLIIPTPALVLVAVFLSEAAANPVPAVVSELPTAIANPVLATSVAAPEPDPAVKTACQKGCNQGYRSCLAHTPRTPRAQLILTVIAFGPGFCDTLRIYCLQCCILPLNPGCNL